MKGALPPHGESFAYPVDLGVGKHPHTTESLAWGSVSGSRPYLLAMSSPVDSPPDKALITCGEAARRLGVAPATLKRWTESGRLPCVRTAGGHRRFEPDQIARFGERLGSEPDALRRWVDRLLQDPDRALSSALLLERARLGAWWRVAEALGSVFGDLGNRWAEGSVCVLEEHAASDRLSRALARCCEPLLPRADRPRMILATAEGEDHTLGLSLVELCARERGWRAVWAGRATPCSELVGAVQRGDVEAVALSASVTSPREVLAREVEELGAACARSGVALVVGGQGPWPDPMPHGRIERTFAGFDTWMQGLEASGNVARGIFPRSVPRGGTALHVPARRLDGQATGSDGTAPVVGAELDS